MTAENTRHRLGAFIRAHREHLPPPAKSTGRRRTPGLRREELADASGIGVTWLTWLEQGREVTASTSALLRLAKALDLSAAERTSLFDLAGKRDPEAPIDRHPDILPALKALPAQFAHPAYVLDHSWTAKAWNAAAADLFTGWLDGEAQNRNLLHFVFLSRQAPRLIMDWPLRANRLAAEFRADYNRRPGDNDMQALIDDLMQKSPYFKELWGEQSVLRREGGERGFNHPRYGHLRFMQCTLLAASQPECKLVCLTPLE